uniref:Immunoglobulin C1-set domain-containing protein n=1 Tax=Equus caballus TaxID=9796 RepID=A0A3Q2HWX7_HORSE
METDTTYMKFSWLTVTGKSMDKEHKCIVQHENNEGGVDQEILFPSVNKVVTSIFTATDSTKAHPKKESKATAINSIEACVKDEDNTLQLTSTYAYYGYLLLLLMSAVYFAIITICLLRRTAACANGKSL